AELGPVPDRDRRRVRPVLLLRPRRAGDARLVARGGSVELGEADVAPGTPLCPSSWPGLSRPSMSSSLQMPTRKTWMPATSAGMTEYAATWVSLPRRLRDRHLVHLHAERDGRVVAEQHQHLSNAGAADRSLDLGKLGVRQLDLLHQRKG